MGEFVVVANCGETNNIKKFTSRATVNRIFPFRRIILKKIVIRYAAYRNERRIFGSQLIDRIGVVWLASTSNSQLIDHHINEFVSHQYAKKKELGLSLGIVKGSSGHQKWCYYYITVHLQQPASTSARIGSRCTGILSAVWCGGITLGVCGSRGCCC